MEGVVFAAFSVGAFVGNLREDEGSVALLLFNSPSTRVSSLRASEF